MNPNIKTFLLAAVWAAVFALVVMVATKTDFNDDYDSSTTAAEESPEVQALQP